MVTAFPTEVCAPANIGQSTAHGIARLEGAGPSKGPADFQTGGFHWRRTKYPQHPILIQTRPELPKMEARARQHGCPLKALNKISAARAPAGAFAQTQQAGRSGVRIRAASGFRPLGHA